MNDNPKNTRLTKLVIRKEGINFFRPTKIKNAFDVANTMSFLQDKSIEQAYAIHIDSKGKETIQMLSIGGKASTTVDHKIILESAMLFKSKKIYLIHNHPSGNLTPSNADIELTKMIHNKLSHLDIELEHIIINTFKNYFALIDKDLNTMICEKEDFIKQSKKKIELTFVDSFKLLKNGPQKQIKKSIDAFNFIQQKRFSSFKKNGALLLNSASEFIGNYFFKEAFDEKELLRFVANTPTTNSVILYTNESINKFRDQMEHISKYVTILDVLQIKENTSINEYYLSYADENLLTEHKNNLKGINPINDFLAIAKNIIKENENNLENKTKNNER